MQNAAISPRGVHDAFSNDNVVLFRQASDLYRGASDESVILDFFIEGFFSSQMKHPRQQPFNIIRETGQYFPVISPGESIHVSLDRQLILAHGSTFANFRWHTDGRGGRCAFDEYSKDTGPVEQAVKIAVFQSYQRKRILFPGISPLLRPDAKLLKVQ